jgi:F-type H+-transporting ATPase subunit b
LKRTRIIGFVAVLLLVGATVAWASEGGGELTPEKWLNFLWRVITFAIVVGVIVKLAAKPLKEFFASRSYQIENELKDLDTRKTDAEKKLKEVEKSIVNLAQEREQVLAEFRQQGEQIKEAIVTKALESAQKIKAQAEVSAAQEHKLAIEKIKADMAEMITQAAEKILQEKLSREDHERLVNEYLTKVVLH